MEQKSPSAGSARLATQDPFYPQYRPGVPAYKQRIYTPSSTPPPPHTPTPEEIAYRSNRVVYPREPSFDRFQSFSSIVRSIKPTTLAEARRRGIFATQAILQSSDKDRMEAIKTALAGIGYTDSQPPFQAPSMQVDPSEYRIDIDDNYHEHARTLVLQMFDRGLGALHHNRIQRSSEMRNEVMRMPWDECIGVVIDNLSRPNPFVMQSRRTQYLDAVWHGLRGTWKDICLHNKDHMDFAEGVCKALWKFQANIKDMSLEYLEMYARLLFSCGQGFWLYNYRLFRENEGHPLGAHADHTLMDKESVPRMLVDFILVLLGHPFFETESRWTFPIEAIDAAGACVKGLVADCRDEGPAEHNHDLLEYMVTAMFSKSRQTLLNYARLSTLSLVFDDFV